MNLGKLMKIKRIEKNLKSEDIAKALNISNVAIRTWECSMHLPKSKYYEGLASILGVSIEDIEKAVKTTKIEKIQGK